MNVLVWNDKNGNRYYAANTPLQELKAYKRVFEDMDAQEFFECSPPEKTMRDLFKRARSGDMKSMKLFVQSRRDYEYERTALEEITEP